MYDTDAYKVELITDTPDNQFDIVTIGRQVQPSTDGENLMSKHVLRK